LPSCTHEEPRGSSLGGWQTLAGFPQKAAGAGPCQDSVPESGGCRLGNKKHAQVFRVQTVRSQTDRCSSDYCEEAMVFRLSRSTCSENKKFYLEVIRRSCTTTGGHPISRKYEIPIVRSPVNMKLPTLLGSFTLTSSITAVGKQEFFFLSFTSLLVIGRAQLPQARTMWVSASMVRTGAFLVLPSRGRGEPFAGCARFGNCRRISRKAL
jgi:hypothetical protein